MKFSHYLLSDASNKFGISESLLLDFGKRGKLPIYIDGTGLAFELGSCEGHSLDHLHSIPIKCPDFIQIVPTFIDSIQKDGTVWLGGTSCCLITARSKKHLEYLSNFAPPLGRKIPESDLGLILSSSPIFCGPGGRIYAGKTGKHDNELELYVFHDDLIGMQKPTESNRKPLPRQLHQEQEILRVIKEMGLEPESLPPYEAGKAGIKADVEKTLKEEDASWTKDVFRKAWQRCRKSGHIKDAL